MKKFKTATILTFTALLLTNSQGFCLSDEELEEHIASIGFGKIFDGNPETKIRNIFEKIDKYSEKGDIEKVQTFFDRSFINNDGFDYDTFFGAMKDSVNSYDKAKCKTEVKLVSVNGNYATVLTAETFKAQTKLADDVIQDTGDFSSYANIYYFLTKIDNKWKITSAVTMDEYAFVAYGSAKNVDMFLTAPSDIRAGKTYTATLKVNVPKNMFALGSLAAGDYLYPMKTDDPVFRSIKDEGTLERVLTATTSGRNQYVTATVGLTDAVVSEGKVNLKLTGSECVMRRVNVQNGAVNAAK